MLGSGAVKGMLYSVLGGRDVWQFLSVPSVLGIGVVVGQEAVDALFWCGGQSVVLFVLGVIDMGAEGCA